MKAIIMMMVLVFLAGCASIKVTQKSWTKEDTARQVAFTAVTCMDWLQTKEIARNPNYYETNKYLGKYPSQDRVNTYFATGIAAHAAISRLLPARVEVLGWEVRPRSVWQYLSIGYEAGFVHHNMNIGIKIGW